MDRMRRIEMVLRAADSGSFTKAAASFDLAPSQVSRAVAALERELKITLFYRTTRQVRLTPEGHEFYRRGRDLLDQLAELENSAAPRARLSGTLRVGISVPVSRLVIMPQLPQFTRKHPDLALEFVVIFHPKDLHAEGLDLLLRVSEPPDTRLIARELMCVKHAVYAAPKYLESRGVPSDPDELLAHRCLVLKPAFLGRLDDAWQFERGDGQRRNVRIARPAVVTGDREGLIDAVVAGEGLMRIGFFDPGLIASGRLRRVLADWHCPPAYSIYAMYRRTLRPAPKITAFLDFATDAFAAFDPQELTLTHSGPRREGALRM